MRKRPWNLALVQAEPVPGDVAAGVAAVRHRLSEIAKRSPAGAPVRVAVFPELFLGGYDLAQVPQTTLRANDAALAEVAGAAGDAGIAVVCGFAELASDGRLLNSATIVDAHGQLRAIYRKTHLFGDERRVFVPGEEATVVDLDGVRLGVGICFDLEFPEYSRLLALQGAQVLCFPTANMVPWARYQSTYAPARAMENQCFVAVVNRIGVEGDYEFFGESGVWGPDGRRLTAAPGRRDWCGLACIDPELSAEVADYPFHYLDERRPALYGPLARTGAQAGPQSSLEAFNRSHQS